MKPFLIILISLLTTLAVYGQSGIADSNGFTNKAEAHNTNKYVFDISAPWLNEQEYNKLWPLVIKIIQSNSDTSLSDSGFTNKAGAKNLTVNGLKEGKWCEYLQESIDHSTIITDSSNATIYRLTFYKNGNPFGIERTYYMNGVLGSEIPYSSGKINGHAKIYYKNGVLSHEAPYIDGKIDGMVYDYYYESGKLQCEMPYTDGNANGEEKTYYENGVLSMSAAFSNDKLNGKLKKYYENGAIAEEGIYSSGLQGVYKYYLKNGTEIYDSYNDGFINKVEAKNLTVNGLKEGKWCEWVLQQIDNIEFTADSTMATRAAYYRLTLYKKGKPIGMVRWYFMNGDLYSETPYINGKENGVEKQYYKGGELEHETTYANGKEVGIGKWYYVSGKINDETPFIKGKINGIQKRYYENGQLQWEIPYKNNTYDGDVKEYYENGKIKSEMKYSNGKAMEVKNYDVNGNRIYNDMNDLTPSQHQ